MDKLKMNKGMEMFYKLYPESYEKHMKAKAYYDSLPADEEIMDYCPCSGKCCSNPSTFTPEHQCMEDVCEYCFDTECENCGKSCCCDL